MARFWLLLLASVSVWPPSASLTVSQRPGAAGVFLLLEGGNYTFNFTAARTACLLHNITMATRAQVERAVQRGLETCKFGWVSEQIAVVPRQTPDRNCGSGKTGAVSWAASPDRKFGAFCFSASDSGSTAGPSPTTAPTKSGPPSAGGPRTTEAPEQTSLTSGSVATPSAPPPHFTPLPHLFTPTPAAASTFLASFPDVSASSQSTNPKSASSSMSPLGEVPMALLILGSILLLLAAAGLVWFFRLRGTSSLWNQEQQMDDIETEMWKNSGSETDLHSQHGEEEEEELDRKYSSDVTLCVTSR